ncbi:MAG: hypothetical protein RIS35_2057 [Pseudomonadota bacterium]|jgi:paraquat-inducible protein B
MRSAGFRVGLFVVAGTALLVLGIVLVAGRWLGTTEQAVMRFETSVYGLQVGAPVVFRGVHVGQVTGIALARAEPGTVAMPVTAELDRRLLEGLLGQPLHGSESAIRALVERGLVARLSTQSLLTGLLYVDLDLAPTRDRAVGAPQDPPSIPTEATRLQTLQAQLGDLDLAQIGRDLAQLSASARRLLDDPEASKLFGRLSSAAQAIEAAALRIDAATGPLARSAEDTLASSREALGAVAGAARRIATAADEVRAAASAGTPAAEAAGRAADELARAATTLRAAAADGSPLRNEAERALRDAAGAARALRELAELLRQQPDALLRGIQESPDAPPAR